MTMAALSDLKVLECGEFISGPYCGKLLADLGAEVIKVEEPGSGDGSRKHGPFPGDIPHPEKSGLFLYLNTNKLGITLNLRTETGRRIFKRLSGQADVLITNCPPKVRGELGLDPEELRRDNPGLILTSVSAFGETGPYRDYEATDLTISGMSGYAHTAIQAPDDQAVPPLKAGGHQTEFQAGLSAAVATLGALYNRDTTGLGQRVDVSSQETFAVMIEHSLSFYTHMGAIASRYSTRVTAPADTLPCRDGFVFAICVSEEQWARLVELMGSPEWAESEFFASGASRAQYWDGLKPLIADWTSRHTKKELYEMAQAHRVPLVPIHTVKDVLESKQLAAREYWTTVDHPVAGRVTVLGAPQRFLATPWRVRRPAPMLGEHNEQVYRARLGFSPRDLTRMRQSGTI